MYDGIEVDMLPVGNADCILITRWSGLEYETMLVDGGTKESYDKLYPFLVAKGLYHIHAVVSTHPHEDHAAGLIQLLEDKRISIGRLYLHWPFNYFVASKVDAALKAARGTQEADDIGRAIDLAFGLVEAAQARKIPWNTQPVQGVQIGPMTVLGPSEYFYREAVSEIVDESRIREFDRINKSYIAAVNAPQYQVMERLDQISLLEDPQTSPLNNTSVILAFRWDDRIYLFTADAGAQALNAAACAYALKGCYVVQIPHHGSRRNITANLIAHFSPKIALVSAEGSLKHPRRPVVNGFKKVGTKVYSTHYPKPTFLRLTEGTVPARLGYGPILPLWDKPKEQAVLPPTLMDALVRQQRNS
jgi:beta-lactamase superfamily II metal-dependent hydrolase